VLGQPGVGLGEVRRTVAGVDHGAEFAELPLAFEGAGVGSFVQHAPHPVREVLCLPDPLQRAVAVLIEKRSRPGGCVRVQTLEPHPDVREGQIEALGTGGRHGVPGVAGQEQVPVAQRLADVAAESKHHLVEDAPAFEFELVGSVEPAL